MRLLPEVIKQLSNTKGILFCMEGLTVMLQITVILNVSMGRDRKHIPAKLKDKVWAQ